MMDVFSKQKRSQIMSHISGKNTKPELLVRSVIHRMGYRFRLHRNDLPGKPDITLPRHKKVIFIHGCFWHGHNDCPRAKRPTTNKSFWYRKLDSNIARDKKNSSELRALGWEVLIIWTCEVKNISSLQEKLTDFLKE